MDDERPLDKGTPLMLALDLGSTHFKAGLFHPRGLPRRISALDVKINHTAIGPVIDPAWAVAAVDGLIAEVLAGSDPAQVAAVGIASMAETGLLVSASNQSAATPLLPWFNRAAENQVSKVNARGDAREHFLWRGILPNFKSPAARLFWLRDEQEVSLRQCTWLSSADYVLLSLTGVQATDYSLASRTAAFRINTKEWNVEWLEQISFPPGLFPSAQPAGRTMGRVSEAAAQRTGLRAGTPVTIAGHDHVCAALAVGAVRPGSVLDSMGTAEALLGAVPERPLTRQDEETGLMYGCHVVEGMMYWMGALSTSGGSVEWLRSVFSDPPLSYTDLEQGLPDDLSGPGDIIFLPYLNGSGAPHADPQARAAWVGLRLEHTRADLYRAVLEGTAYEMEYIRRSALAVKGVEANRLLAIGGGTQNRRWLQIKADVCGQAIEVPAVREATLAGAALLAGAACGYYPDPQAAVHAAQEQAAGEPGRLRFDPDADRHSRYQAVYEQGFLALQESVSNYSKFIAGRKPQ